MLFDRSKKNKKQKQIKRTLSVENASYISPHDESLGEEDYFNGVALDCRNASDKSIQLLVERLGAPLPAFSFLKEEVDFFSRYYHESNGIQFAILRIFRHIKMPVTEYKVYITYFKDDTRKDAFIVDMDGTVTRASPSDGTAGNYFHSSKGTALIQISINEHYSKDNVFAIICHECMHHYLFHKQIKFGDNSENEILTDTAAVFMGFGNNMIKGYKPVEYYDSTVGVRRRITIGYISTSEISEIQTKTARIQENFSIIAMEKNELEILRKNAEHRISVFRDVYERYSNCFTLIIERKNVAFSPSDFLTFQAYLLSKEHDDTEVDTLCNQASRIRSRHDASAFEADSDRLCTEYTRRTVLLSKYLSGSND